ncbi:Lrp/AsnC ligand binding domain-containing protein [Candidatus Bathyarchaeota archaeon]|nr:Lrp/AsnC ligand binding domain-containing protein [Candidatus Bathyarchaeota archaeon]
MAHAFIFINTEPGSETEVLRQIRQKPEVKEAYMVQGIYDLIAKVETDSKTRLRETADKIRGLNHVRSLLVLMTVHSDSAQTIEIRQKSDKTAQHPSS